MDYFLARKMQLKVRNKSHAEMCDIKCCHNDTTFQSSNPDQFLEIQGEEREMKHL